MNSNILNYQTSKKKKYNKLVKILSIKLNKIHKKKYHYSYWDKILGYFVLYHITACNRFFNSKIKSINYFSKKRIKILDDKNFYIPKNINNYRKCFQHSDFGQQQLFSLVFRFFYQRKLFNKFSSHYDKNKKEIKKNKKTFSFELLYYRFLNLIIRKIKHNSFKILVTRCYWSERHKQKIQLSLKGNLRCKDFYIPSINLSINNKLRNKLQHNNFNLKMDRFDKFFFYTLKYCLPKSVLEEYSYREKFTIDYLKKYLKLKYIINEAIDEDSMLLISQAKKKKIKSIYCEHNFLQNQFIGNIIEFIKIKFDYYFTLGWRSKDKKFISGGSFFEWIPINKNKIQNIPILFAEGVTVYRPPFTCSAYGESGKFNSENYIKMTKVFFNNLNSNILQNMWIKKYPPKYKKTFCYNPADKLIEKSKIKLTNNVKNSDLELSKYFNSAKLIVTNYLSTSYLQALISNKPAIIFFNSKSYFLNNKYKKIYDGLIKNNIMFKDPKKAASFLNKNFHKIDKWWSNKQTQEARLNFIRNNIKDPEYLYSVIKKKLK